MNIKKVWLINKHSGPLDTSWRVGNMEIEMDRVVVRCPDSGNVLINCTKKFFDVEVSKGRIIICK